MRNTPPGPARRLLAQQLIVPPAPMWAVYAGAAGPHFDEIAFLNVAYREIALREPFRLWQVDGYVSKRSVVHKQFPWSLWNVDMIVNNRDAIGALFLGFADSTELESWMPAWLKWKEKKDKVEARRTKAKQYNAARKARKLAEAVHA